MHQAAPTMPEADLETLMRRYLPLVRRVARRHQGRTPGGVDLDDLVSWGMTGLLEALTRFDPSRNDSFPAFARFRIRGAILDQLRALDWVPRSVRDKAEGMARATSECEARLGRPATESELAAALGLSLPRYREALRDIAPVTVIGLDEAGDADAAACSTAAPDAEPLGGLLQRERAGRVADAIRGLPEREQVLLSLYYRDDLTMKEVGAVLGITESRVSQLHTQALLRLRAQLADASATGGRRALKLGAQTADLPGDVPCRRPNQGSSRRAAARDASRACGR